MRSRPSGYQNEGARASRRGVSSGFMPPTSAAEMLARSIAHGPTFAHAMTRHMPHQEWNMSVDEAIEAEAQAQAMCMHTNDFRRADEPFSASPRQRPVFQGD